jgi:hypothetical protein
MVCVKCTNQLIELLKLELKYNDMIKVHLLSQSKPIEYNDVENSYTKDGMYCIYTKENKVHKYPMVNIFRVEENY